MATVYLAHDIRHDRKVALKVLRPELAAVIGAERFLAEIRTTANLQHPHILPLFDSGQAGGFLFYVMPFVEGETVRDRLTREKQLPVADAVRIATEVANALGYAHRHGVVHRDIKPENILLHDGAALVADFGIALALSTAGGTRMTETGISLGTPHYMSPEQAMGEREITARSDVYALGCVTYEMLLGEPPFTGPTAQFIVAKLLTEKPAPLSPRRDRISPEVEEAVLTALEKLPADRWGSAKEFADALAGTAPRRHVAAAAPRAGGPLRLIMLPAVTGIAVVAIGSALYFARQAHRRPIPAVARFALRLPNFRAGQRLYGGNAFVLSSDGARLAYVGTSATGGTELWVRDRDHLTPRSLPGTDGADGPFVSPDGQWMGYFAGGRLYKIAVSGGTPDRPGGLLEHDRARGCLVAERRHSLRGIGVRTAARPGERWSHHGPHTGQPAGNGDRLPDIVAAPGRRAADRMHQQLRPDDAGRAPLQDPDAGHPLHQHRPCLVSAQW